MPLVEGEAVYSGVLFTKHIKSREPNFWEKCYFFLMSCRPSYRRLLKQLREEEKLNASTTDAFQEGPSSLGS